MSDNIKVAVRMRNLIPREVESKAAIHWAIKDPDCIYQANSPKTSFAFDRVFSGHESNEVVYSEFCSFIVKSVMDGFNGTIFAYGQTSSGKTYTIMGDDGISLGIAQYTVSDLFEHIQSKPEREFLLRVSYMEIYNEMVIDLLSDSSESLKLQEDQYGNIKVHKLTEFIVQEPTQVLDLMKKGQRQRRTGDTVMNNKSSRSHSIFRMIIESGLRGAENAAVNVSQFNLVDLAGSEKASLNKGSRFKEGININKSLFMLSQVISQLSQLGEKENQFINYRDSKLTRILQNSLGGNALTAIICTITPASLDETISTLKFARNAKKIKNIPHVNEIETEQALLKKYANKIKRLREELEATKEEKIQETETCRNLKEQIENLKKKFVSHIAPETTRSARRETWGGCLDTARMKAMLPLPKDLLLPHELPESTDRLMTRSLSFTPRKKFKKKTVNDKDLTILEEESEADIEDSESVDITSNLLSKNRRSTLQSKISIDFSKDRLTSECWRTEDVAVQTEFPPISVSPSKASVEKERLESTTERVLELEKELAELKMFTTLEKQMFKTQERKENISESQFSKSESTCSVFLESEKPDLSSYSPLVQEMEDESFGIISSLVNLDINGGENIMNLDQEMFFNQLNIVIRNIGRLLNVEIMLPAIQNPYIKTIYELISLFFQSQTNRKDMSNNCMTGQIEELLNVLSKIFIGFSSKCGTHEEHKELVGKFINMMPIVMEKLQISSGVEENKNVIDHSTVESNEKTMPLHIPDLINVSGSKSGDSSLNCSKMYWETKESQTSMCEDDGPTDSALADQQKISLLEEDLKKQLKAISDLQHNCSLKEKQILLSMDKIKIQEQIITSLREELNLRQETEKIELIPNNLKDNFTQTQYMDSSIWHPDTQEADQIDVSLEEVVSTPNISSIKEMGVRNIVTSAININSVGTQTTELLSNMFTHVTEDSALESSKPLPRLVPGNNPTGSTDFLNKSMKHQYELEDVQENSIVEQANHVDLAELLKELVDLKTFTFRIMTDNMEKENLDDITLDAMTDSCRNVSYDLAKLDVKSLKDMLMRIEFYLKNKAESFEHFNGVLEENMQEVWSLQQKFSTAEMALKEKEKQLINLGEALGNLRKNISEEILQLHMPFERNDLDYEDNGLNGIYFNDIMFFQHTINQLGKSIKERESEIDALKKLQEKHSAQTVEGYSDLAMVEELRQSEMKDKEEARRENTSLKLKIEELNEEIKVLKQETLLANQKVVKAEEAYQNAISEHGVKEKAWAIQMKECIKSIEERYEQEMNVQENEFFAKLEDLSQKHRVMQLEKDETHQGELSRLREDYEKQMLLLKEMYANIQSQDQDRLSEERREKEEEIIKFYKSREYTINQSYTKLRKKFNDYIRDVNMKVNKKKLLVDQLTQTQPESFAEECKSNKACGECASLHQQILKLQNAVSSTKETDTTIENLNHELDTKKAKIMTLEVNNHKMVREIGFLKKDLASREHLLRTCECRSIAKAQEMLEEISKKHVNTKTCVPGTTNVDKEELRSSNNPRDVLQLEIVQKAIQDARKEERVLLCRNSGPANDLRCIVLENKLHRREKELHQLKTLAKKKSNMIASEDKVSSENNLPIETKHKPAPTKMHPIEMEKNFTPLPKSGHPYLDDFGAIRKVQPKKILIERNKAVAVSQNRNPNQAFLAESAVEVLRGKDLNMDDMQAPECKQQ